MNAPRIGEIRYFVAYNYGVPEDSVVYGVRIDALEGSHEWRGHRIDRGARVVRAGLYEGYATEREARLQLARMLEEDAALTLARSSRMKLCADGLRAEFDVDCAPVRRLVEATR